MKGRLTMIWTDFSKKVVAGAIAPVLVAGLAPAMAFADDAGESLAAASVEVAETSDALTTQADADATITFSDSGITSTSTDNIKIDGTSLTINKAGTYIITGSCSSGQIAVKKGVEGVTLVLKDLTLENDGDKAIKFKAGSSGTIELQGTNTLSTTNNKGIIKANAVEDDDENLVYDEDGNTTGGDLTITGTGTLNLSSDYKKVVDGETEDCDAINCEGDLTVLSGTFNIDVTDDGMHADNTLTIGAEGTAGPTINVTNSTEGLEGATVNILSGTGSIVSTDDGINAANADLADYNWPYSITIAGGTWTVNAEGDGLDSNGDLTISGGETVVYGPTSGGNGVFDIGDGNYSFSVTGGTLLGMGTSDMAITPTSGTYVVFGSGGMGGNMGGMPGNMGGNDGGMRGGDSNGSGNMGGGGMPGMPGGNGNGMPGMGAMSDGSADESAELTEQAGPGGAMPGQDAGGSSYTIAAGQTVTVQDSSGNTLISKTAAKNAQWALYASGDLEEGQTYTLNADGTQLTTASATGGSSVPGGQQGQPGQSADGQQPGQPADGQQPGQPADGQQQENQGQQQGPSGSGSASSDERTTSGQMHRLYNPYTGEHFYTADDGEYKNVVNAGWTDEGFGWTSPEAGDPVYRLYNPYAGEHHYTLDAAERANLIEAGWTDEGIGWYSDSDKTVPLYREYNPNEPANNHNYTSDKAEHENLVTLGWIDEGIAWYGIA